MQLVARSLAPHRARSAPDRVTVLHVITRLVGGGADENTIETVLALHRACARYAPAVAAGPESDPAIVARLGGRAPFLLVPHLHREVLPAADLLALCELVRTCRLTRCDIVHTHTAKAGVLGRIAARIAGVPIVIHGLHGHTFHPFVPQPARFVYRQLERLAARCTTRYISVSRMLTDMYLAAGVGRPAQYVTVYSGMRLERFRAPGKPVGGIRRALGVADDARVIATVSRLEPAKGVTDFLDVAARVHREVDGCRFLVVGGGPERAPLEARARALALDGAVIFTGYRTDVPDLLSACDVFVFTSLWEGLPRVLVQASAAGKPIVAFRAVGVPEIVHHGVNGYLIEPRDTAAMAERVVDLLRRPDIATRMGYDGRALIDDRWAVDTMTASIERIYADLLPARSPDEAVPESPR
jgi:glycosyltransferase involved in cell wall biosynthesis